jgi:hypothetical protein
MRIFYKWSTDPLRIILNGIDNHIVATTPYSYLIKLMQKFPRDLFEEKKNAKNSSLTSAISDIEGGKGEEGYKRQSTKKLKELRIWFENQLRQCQSELETRMEMNTTLAGSNTTLNVPLNSNTTLNTNSFDSANGTLPGSSGDHHAVNGTQNNVASNLQSEAAGTPSQTDEKTEVEQTETR